MDGETKIEGEFPTVKEAWQRSNDMGSRWFFYPFHFVVTSSGKTIKDAPDGLCHFIGQKTQKVCAAFLALSQRPDMANADVDTFTANL